MTVEAESLNGLKFFESLDLGARAVLAQSARIVPLPADGVVFQSGDDGDSFFVVKSGSVELFAEDRAGQKIVLTIAQAGEAFGELSLLDGRPRTATARALEDTELVAVERDDFLDLIRQKPDAALQMLAALSGMTRRADELLRSRVTRNANDEVAEKLTLVERAADWIAWFSGSMYFLALNVAWFAGWIAVNTMDVGIRQFDPFPFGLLTMIVSLEAIFLSIFVLISQNRQAAKDRVRADIEYDVNVKAELEVANLHEKIDHIQETMLDRFARLDKSRPSPKNGETPDPR